MSMIEAEDPAMIALSVMDTDKPCYTIKDWTMRGLCVYDRS